MIELTQSNGTIDPAKVRAIAETLAKPGNEAHALFADESGKPTIDELYALKAIPEIEKVVQMTNALIDWHLEANQSGKPLNLPALADIIEKYVPKQFPDHNGDPPEWARFFDGKNGAEYAL